MSFVSEWRLPPWTAEEVAHINEFQRSRAMHPLTCGCGPEDADHVLGWPNRVRVAHTDGLHCPNGRCPVQTTHVFRDITNGSLLRSIHQDWTDARSAAKDATQQNDWDF